MGYVDATRSVLKEVRKGIETKWAAVVDQAISIEQFVAYELSRICFNGYVKTDMRSGSGLRQDTRSDFTDHRH